MNELKLLGYTPSVTLVVKVFDALLVQVGPDVSVTEVGTSSGNYLADMPSAPAAEYFIGFYDGATLVADGTIQWDGSQEVENTSVSVIASSNSLKMKTEVVEMEIKSSNSLTMRLDK